MADVKALAENLVGLTVKEVQELAEFLKSEYGIEPAAAAVVVSIPISILFIIMQRFYVDGLTGAVKG